MIVEEIHVVNVTLLEAENDAPIGPNPHSPLTFSITFKPVQAQARKVQVLRLFCSVQQKQDVFNPLNTVRWQFPAITFLEQPTQGFASEMADHTER